MGIELVILDASKLRKLAKLLRNQEEPLFRNIRSGPERNLFLKACNESYDNTVSLIEKSNELVDKYEKDDLKTQLEIAKDITSYVIYSVNMGLQCIRNSSLRATFVGKVAAHVDSLIGELAKLDITNISTVNTFLKEVKDFKDTMWEYTKSIRSDAARALSKSFSRVLKQEGIKFPELIKRYKNKLGFKESFERLEEPKKLMVYNSIISESGRAKLPTLEFTASKVGVAVMVVNAGILVWDIFTADHKVETVLETSLRALADVGAFAVQVAVEAAVTEALVEAELSLFVVSMAGFVAGLVAGLLFVVVSGALIDMIFATGGSMAPGIEDLKFHSAKMPDGMALAYQLSRRG